MARFRPNDDFVPKTLPPSPTALELAGHGIGFAAWCIAGGGGFVSMIFFIKDGKIALVELEAKSKGESVAIWQKWAMENPQGADYSAYATDATITEGGVKTDAIILVIVNHADGNDSRVIARYHPKKWFKPFAIEAPEAIVDGALVHLSGADRDAFFRGVMSFPQGHALWADHLPAKT